MFLFQAGVPDLRFRSFSLLTHRHSRSAWGPVSTPRRFANGDLIIAGAIKNVAVEAPVSSALVKQEHFKNLYDHPPIVLKISLLDVY